MLVSASDTIANSGACMVRVPALLQPGHGRDKAIHEPGLPSLARGGLAPWQILRVKAHVEDHLDSTIRIGDLAAIARLSTGHFSRSFKRSLGMAPLAYLAERRLARAQNLMLATDDALSRIALDCGFYDQPHLTRMFRHHIGTSPNHWRRCRGGGNPRSLAAPPMPGLNQARWRALSVSPAFLGGRL